MVGSRLQSRPGLTSQDEPRRKRTQIRSISLHPDPTLLYYAIANLSALKLPSGQRLYPPWIAWTGLFACLAMALSLRPRTVLTGLGLLAGGCLLRWCLHRLVPPPPVATSHGQPD